jgi:hypothetical protein
MVFIYYALTFLPNQKEMSTCVKLIVKLCMVLVLPAKGNSSARRESRAGA